MLVVNQEGPYFKKKPTPPPRLVLFKQAVATSATRDGTLWLKRYPLSHPLFPIKCGIDYAGCGALWSATQPEDNKHKGSEMLQDEFNKLWKTRVKSLPRSKRPDAMEQLRLELIPKVEATWEWSPDNQT